MNVPVRERTTPLRQYLDANGIRYGWVAKKLGITASYLTHLLNGRDALPVKHAETLSTLFDVPIETFLPPMEGTEITEEANG
jgi:transcriptional regulator with XRE-family HTH domain